MTLLRGWEIEKTMRNHSNNIVLLTISENKLCVRKKILCLTLFLFLFFISIVSPPVSLTTGHWSPAPVISEDHVLMPGPGLITGPWQKPSDYIRHRLAQGRGPESFLHSPQQGLCSRQKLILAMLHQIIDGWYFNFRQMFSRATRPFEHL